MGQEVIFEIGTEEQSGSTNSQEALDYTLNAVQHFCKKNNMTQPSFVVIQTGTRVMETRNIGSFDSPVRVADELPAEETSAKDDRNLQSLWHLHEGAQHRLSF